MAVLLLQNVVNGVAHGPQLPVTGAGREDKVIKRCRLLPHVENQHILPAVVFRLPGRCQRQFEAVISTRPHGWLAHCCDHARSSRI